MTLNEASRITGGLSRTSKMPCRSYGTPARLCVTGSALRKVAGSTCSNCYALKGAYLWAAVQKSYDKRARSMRRALRDERFAARWVLAMATLIAAKSKASGVFRWWDSGDFWSAEHVALVLRVCRATPQIRHWIPTREYAFVSKAISAGGPLPSNVLVRYSAHMIGLRPPQGAHGSMVILPGMSDQLAGDDSIHRCPSRQQHGKCGPCRACWSTDVRVVAYELH